jgi:hypothetical protein
MKGLLLLVSVIEIEFSGTVSGKRRRNGVFCEAESEWTANIPQAFFALGEEKAVFAKQKVKIERRARQRRPFN